MNVTNKSQETLRKKNTEKNIWIEAITFNCVDAKECTRTRLAQSWKMKWMQSMRESDLNHTNIWTGN